MSNDKIFKEQYIDVFDEVHASEELLRKVKNMANQKKTRSLGKIRKVVYIAAALIAILAISNFATYAATGDGIDKHIENAVVKVFNIDGKEVKAELLTEGEVVEFTEDGCEIKTKVSGSSDYNVYTYDNDDIFGVIIDAKTKETTQAD
jgi:hypothetical protein